MPNYTYNSNWPDAAAYGQGLGQSLGQAMIGIPRERAELALRLAQMQQTGGLRQQQQMFNQQRLQDQDQWHSQADIIRQQLANQTGQWQQGQLENQGLRNQLEMLKLQQGRVEDNYWVPGVGGGGQGQPTDQGLRPPNFDNAQISLPSGQSQVPQQQQAPPQQQPQGLPGGITALPRQAAPMNVNPNAALLNQINLLKLKAGVGGTNSFPAILSAISNLQNNASSPMTPQGLGQQPSAPRVRQWNPVTGQIE